MEAKRCARRLGDIWGVQEMQFHYFHSGGYVLHKITGYWSGRCSAWFDKEGKLLAAEQFRGDIAYPVKVGGPMWNELRRIGQRYKNVPTLQQGT